MLQFLSAFCCFCGFLSWQMPAAGEEEGQSGSSTMWSFTCPDLMLRPYDWAYLRVDLPPWFSSVTMGFTSGVDINNKQIKKLPKSTLPVICFSQGRPPLPDISSAYLDSVLSNFVANGSFVEKFLQNMEQCIPYHKNLTISLAKDQISSGVWYIGVFNGLGSERTQSKMISRGHSYTLSASINVQGCGSSTIWGSYCNNSIDMISCSPSINYKQPRSVLESNLFRSSDDLNLMNGRGLYSAMSPNISVELQNLVDCSNSFMSCIGIGEVKFFALDIVGSISHFTVAATHLMLNQTSISNNSTTIDEILLMCYVRYNAIPLSSLYDQSADISRTPLVVKLPKIGRWYVALQVIKQKNTEAYSDSGLCFSFEWQLHQCFDGKAGENCTSESYVLQRLLKRGSNNPMDSYYLPVDENGSLEEANFRLDYRLSNSSADNVAWTSFFFDVPHGAAGSNLHVQLTSDKVVNYEIYSRYGGMASIDTWDFYVNSKNNSNGSMILTSNDISKGRLEFYLLYVREGLWNLVLKHASDIGEHQSTMSISLVGCPKHCSSNGQCHYSIDESGLTFYSFCYCDRNHGGFDCSDELVSPRGHFWHSIFLVASNGAAILPAFWCLRKKAFAEWVLFTSSGVSSGLYHACDVGTWCPLSFHALQFMDFWLSFMAVVSTFVYMATIEEASKRAIHTIVAIITALLAVTGATRSENIIIVIAIGTLGLLLGWFLEFSAANRHVCPPRFNINILSSMETLYRSQSMKRLCLNLVKAVLKRYYWPFLLLGFVGLAFAGTSWALEANETYWFWHSLWHISIYSSSFFFLCSTSPQCNSQQDPEYELTRHDSSSRDYALTRQDSLSREL
ncbi:hypothetical protein HPP92_022633 [Vanilla planifolia]|uniref:EGF-like domain-containing protein n=1 Tax=Vanilla planifolia TaxID=51239 RepID=A0A835PNW5_VANPL|nr:hypothetical protein HPP92_022633 [Vanilla planifolia]